MRVGTGPLRWSADQVTYTASAALGAAAYSEPFYIAHLEGASFVIKVPATGTPAGSFKVQVSNTTIETPPAGIPDATVMDWADSGATVASAGSGETLYVQHAPAHSRWTRLVYTRTSGTGSATATAHGKGAH